MMGAKIILNVDNALGMFIFLDLSDMDVFPWST